MSVEKRREGYCVRWRDSSGVARSQQVRLWRDAVVLDGEMKRKKAMGELIAHERGTATLEEFWDVWWRRYALVHLTPRTRATYRALWVRNLSPTLGRIRLSQVTGETVVDLTQRLSSRLAAGSVRKCLTVLQCVFQRAVEWQWVAVNPVVGAKKPPLVQRDGRALTATEVSAVISEFKPADVRSRTIVAVLAGSGLRPGELRALRWRDIAEGILVERAASSNAIGPTKTRSKRQVMLRDTVAQALAEWSLARGRPAPGDLIFPGRDGRLWSDQGWASWQQGTFNPAASRAGLSGTVPYDLRHTFASTLIAEGHDIYWIARQLGHSPTMTLETYAHLFKSVYSECAAQPSRVEIPNKHGSIARH